MAGPRLASIKDIFTNLQRKRNTGILYKELTSTVCKPLQSIMVKRPVCVNPDTTLEEAARIMRNEALSCLIVKEKEAIKGLITESDFTRKVSADSLQQRVSAVMTESVYCATPDTTIIEAMKAMASNKFRKLPIVANGKLVGIATQTDIVKAIDRFATHSIIDTMNTVRVWQIMTEKIVTVDQSEKAETAKKIMAEKRIGCIFATKDESITGIITEKDLVNELVKNPKRLTAYRVQDIMKSPVSSIPSSHQLFEANHYLIEKQFRRLLIKTEGKAAGVVTQTDICHAAYRFIDYLIKKIKDEGILEMRLEKL